jgi:hypothetical protein
MPDKSTTAAALADIFKNPEVHGFEWTEDEES